jgi:hypothetical protein
MVKVFARGTKPIFTVPVPLPLKIARMVHLSVSAWRRAPENKSHWNRLYSLIPRPIKVVAGVGFGRF